MDIIDFIVILCSNFELIIKINNALSVLKLRN